jgi:hypothetical protein
MKRIAVRALLGTSLLLCLARLGDARIQAGPATPTPCCDLVAQALKDYSSLKVGGMRSDLDRYFRESGGASIGNQIVYVYKKCPYIHLTVTFASLTNTPSDVIAGLSKLSIDYEAKD